MKKIYELYEGINLNDDPSNPIDKIMWAKYKEKLDEETAKKMCRKSKFMCAVYNTETNDFLCYKRIDYQDILNELKKSIVDR